MKNPFVKIKTEKIDPRSNTFVAETMKLLEEHGITHPRKKNECSLALFRSTVKFYKGIEKFAGTDQEIDPVDIEKQEQEMMSILARYGISSPEEQEVIIINYFTTLNELGMGGMK